MRRVLAPAVLSTDDGGQNTKARIHYALPGRMDSGRGGHSNFDALTSTALPIVDATGRANPQGRGRKDGVSTPTVIFALCLEESKGENDVPQLQNQMPEVWTRPQG